MKIGLDIGGTKISAVAYNKKVIKKIIIPTGKTKKEIISNIKELINKLDDGKIEKIGIGIPGLIKKDKIISCQNIKFLVGINLAKILKRKIILINDAYAFVLAETVMGVAKGKNNVVGLIIGTGIGSGIIINGQLYKGNNQAGNIGHVWTAPFSEKNFESQWSGPALERMYEELSGNKAKLEEISKMKTPEAKSVINYAIQGIAYICSIYANILNPEIIVLGGGVSNLNIYFQINKELKKLCYKPPKVVKNKLGADAGVIGATLA